MFRRKSSTIAELYADGLLTTFKIDRKPAVSALELLPLSRHSPPALS
jgi:hypothetical protein